MMPTIRDISYLLRQGKLIGLADETGWSVAADPTHDDAVRQLLLLRQPALLPTVLIGHTEQLGLYVGKLPDVAFDLVDFADNPLTVYFPQGKNVAPALLELTGPEIAIRRSLTTDVQRLIGGFGKGLLTVPFETTTLPTSAETVIAERYGAVPMSMKKPRIMRLGLGGEVQFIRK